MWAKVACANWNPGILIAAHDGGNGTKVLRGKRKQAEETIIEAAKWLVQV
jgi:hypothetical protein